MKIKSIIFCTACLLLFAGCYKDDPITPSGRLTSGGDLVFDFPQGNNAYDDDIVAFANEYDIKVIYKDFTLAHFNRSWVASTMSTYNGYDTPADLAGKHAEFMINQVLRCIPGEFAKKYYPPYLYLVYGWHSVSVFGTSLSQYKWDGLDFYLVSLESDFLEPELPLYPGYRKTHFPARSGTDTPPVVTYSDTLRVRCDVLLRGIRNAVENGKIPIPSFFTTDFDYTTAVKAQASKTVITRDEPGENADDPNFYMARGFPGYYRNNTNTVSGLTSFSSISVLSPKQLFLSYIVFCCMVDDDGDLLVKSTAAAPANYMEYFNLQKYPKLAIYRDKTHEYFLEKYGVDLYKIRDHR